MGEGKKVSLPLWENMCLCIKGIFSNDPIQTSSHQGQKSTVREEIAKEDVGCCCSHDHNVTEETQR